MARVSKEFVALGMTKAEYLEMEALAGKEQAETLGFTVTLEWHLGEDNVEAKLPVSAIEERGGGKKGDQARRCNVLWHGCVLLL